eukprot:scaffold1750_cov19-Tisochrysis_lutea.AAC.1
MFEEPRTLPYPINPLPESCVQWPLMRPPAAINKSTGQLHVPFNAAASAGAAAAAAIQAKSGNSRSSWLFQQSPIMLTASCHPMTRVALWQAQHFIIPQLCQKETQVFQG